MFPLGQHKTAGHGCGQLGRHDAAHDNIIVERRPDDKGNQQTGSCAEPEAERTRIQAETQQQPQEQRQQDADFKRQENNAGNRILEPGDAREC